MRLYPLIKFAQNPLKGPTPIAYQLGVAALRGHQAAILWRPPTPPLLRWLEAQQIKYTIPSCGKFIVVQFTPESTL